VPFGLFFLNSLKVAGLITLGQLVTCTLAAYAFARLRFPGRELLFGIYLSSLMVPSQVTIIPLYILMRNLGLIDNHASLILPALASAFGIFFLRQFFLTIPRELEEAAIVDGAGLLRVLLVIILPLSQPALAALAIFTFNYYWNDFFAPLIFLNSPQNLTLPVGLELPPRPVCHGQSRRHACRCMHGGAAGPAHFPYWATLYRRRITLTGLKG
jgi:multiple sugar transport system permease protein